VAWDQQGGTGGSGEPEGFGAPPPPPPPQQPPYIPPTGSPYGAPFGPQAEPPAPLPPGDPLRAVAAGLLNLSGLGLGHLLTRRWAAMAACWIATGVFALVALPADADGVSGGAVVAYLVFLLLAAAHGAYRALRTPLLWPPKPLVAVLLGLVLLAAPAGAVVAYDDAHTEAHNEAVQKMLLERLGTADRLVATARTKPFDSAQSDWTTALETYRNLQRDHPDSRAGKLVPKRLATYYTAVATPYGQERYCDAVAPLKYLRTVPQTYGRTALGSLATWPDDRLATALYECGISAFTRDDDPAHDGDLGELLTTFPKSAQAAKVEPAVRSTIADAAKGISGSDPCAATERLRALGAGAAGLPGEAAGLSGALTADAHRADGHVQSGTYACAVHQYKAADFDGALDTINGFIKQYPHDGHRALAQKIAIAAEIAVEVPEAGKKMPTLAGTGGPIPVTVSNDSPDDVEVLFTGPVTGSFRLKACGSCSSYSSEISASTSACKDTGKNYPKKTVNLPAGTTYFLHKSTSGSTATPGSDTAKLRYGYIYTECAYVVENPYGF
jgi:hypothetical protein